MSRGGYYGGGGDRGYDRKGDSDYYSQQRDSDRGPLGYSSQGAYERKESHFQQQSHYR